MNRSEIRGNHNTVYQNASMGPAGKCCALCGSGDILTCASAVAQGTFITKDAKGNEITTVTPFAQAARHFGGSDHQSVKIMFCLFSAFFIVAFACGTGTYWAAAMCVIPIWILAANFKTWLQVGSANDNAYSRTWICRNCQGRTIFW